MRQFSLPKKSETMTDAAYIDEAVDWSKKLTRMKARGPGDLENAMRQIEREYGVDYWTLYALRYRRNRIRDIGVSIYMRLRAAYEAECARQMRRLAHEIETTRKIAGASHPAVAAAAAVVGAAEGEEEIGE